jgi:hypothetical protein
MLFDGMGPTVLLSHVNGVLQQQQQQQQQQQNNNNNNKTNSVVSVRKANYTARATAACRRS